MGKKEENKVFHITHKGEVLFWLIIILLFVATYNCGVIFKEKHDENDYQIFLQDVDGLIVGSPVRMMGIEVGHVTKIKPTNEEVYVKFILTNPDVYIPQGTKVTVEFSGMAGSKSLELYLPNNSSDIDNSTPVLSIMPPKRLHDALGLLNDMFKKIGSIIYTTSSFGKKLETNVLQELDKNGIENFLEHSDSFIEHSNNAIYELKQNKEGGKKDAK